MGSGDGPLGTADLTQSSSSDAPAVLSAFSVAAPQKTPTERLNPSFCDQNQPGHVRFGPVSLVVFVADVPAGQRRRTAWSSRTSKSTIRAVVVIHAPLMRLTKKEITAREQELVRTGVRRVAGHAAVRGRLMHRSLRELLRLVAGEAGRVAGGLQQVVVIGRVRCVALGAFAAVFQRLVHVFRFE